MKKIHKYITVAVCAVSVLFTAGCDVLNQEPVDSFKEESLFSEISLVEAFLYECYDQMGGNKNEVLGMREDLLSSSTDETLNIHRAGNVVFTKGTLSPSYLQHFGDNSFYSWITWKALYKDIQNINTLLDGIDNVPTVTASDIAKKKQIKAEAYFLRAFEYTNLLRSYGGVVLIDKKFKLEDDYLNMKRSSLQETVDFILQDIEKAIADLPLKEDMEQGRATKGAAAALKSRLLSFITGDLTNGGYSPNPLVSLSGNRQDYYNAAKNAAKDIIDGKFGQYALHGTISEPPANMTDEQVKEYAESYGSIFVQKGAWNDEVIFGVQYLNEATGNKVYNNLFWGPNGYSCWGNNEPIENFVRLYEMKDGTPFQWDKYNPGDENIRSITKEEETSNPEKNPYVGREPRFYANILYEGAPWVTRASTNNKIDVGYKVASAGKGLVGKDVASFMAEIAKLESVTSGGYDSRSAPTQAWNGTKTGYYLRKMLDINIVDGETERNTNAWIEMRYAEVLLDYAEACIELGEIEEGLKYVNQLRNRAGLPSRATNVSQEEARKWYRHERMIEMFAEGDRWYCIRKWMLCEEVIKSFSATTVYHFNDGITFFVYNTTSRADERNWNNANYWLPISIAEIKRAPQLEQNPNY